MGFSPRSERMRAKAHDYVPDLTGSPNLDCSDRLMGAYPSFLYTFAAPWFLSVLCTSAASRTVEASQRLQPDLPLLLARSDPEERRVRRQYLPHPVQSFSRFPGIFGNGAVPRHKDIGSESFDPDQEPAAMKRHNLAPIRKFFRKK